jgi:ATP-dependent DNA helicase RecQ
MKKLSANYSYTNNNFIIQNLRGQRVVNEYLPGICILKNIVQRGKPTLLSAYLQENLGSIHNNSEFKRARPLIDRETPNWIRVIRGSEKDNYFPAKKFFDELLPKYLTDYAFIRNLIIPEIPINDITQVEVDEFLGEQVDFYFPQAYLVIEIDGSQHERTKEEDKRRDAHLSKYGIHTVRIKVVDVESESQVFLQLIQKIKTRIEKVIVSQAKRKIECPTFISIDDYRSAFEHGVDLREPNYRATAVIRFQLLILDLIELGVLDFVKPWRLELIERDVEDFSQLAIDDLFLWLANIYKLQKVAFKVPQVTIDSVDSIDSFSNDSSVVKIDFSILRRYTDEFQTKQEVLFIRTDYLDEYLYFKKGDSRDRLVFSSFHSYDYFAVSSTKPIEYKLKFGGNDSDEQSLRFLLWNIFLQNDNGLRYDTLAFREGQLPIIANALALNNTIGLLPTGSGKSVCYQLSAILQPSISFVVCPIKSLMYDQKADLDSAYFTRVNHLTSNDDGEDKERIQNEFARGKYFFIFISPERFQSKIFRQYFRFVNEKYSIAYAVIDEVHCLSEWGHDFRTSYLNLSKTIQKLCSRFKFLALTATASINVLKDIQIELGVGQEDVKTPVEYAREELEFVVIDDKNDKFKVINSQLQRLKESIQALEEIGTESKCGIIFTPTVNGRNGCYPLSQKLTEHLKKEVKFYAGSVPTIDQQPIMSDKDFDKYKKDVQVEFKQNIFTLLTATKAFGMGINKGNIHYTFHYGIPGSTESLYQEAGRAGRDKVKFGKKKAQCFVLLSKTDDKNTLSKIWNRSTTLSQIKELRRGINGDVSTNVLLFSLGMDVIRDEFEIIKKLFSSYSFSNRKNVRIEGIFIGYSKAQTEKAIYRLSQLGIVEDWTIGSFFNGGVFEVDFCHFDELSIRKCLLKTINKYDAEFSFELALSEERYSAYRKILQAPNLYSEVDKNVLILLQWSYDNFAYNRRESLKNIYENCCDYADGVISGDQFKLRLENYFKFTQSSFVLQHIAENPKDFMKWFEVFYQVNGINIISGEIISKRQQETLRDNLRRFLESYMYNTGLDMVSGLVRLLLDDYGNADGRARLESSLAQIARFDQTFIDYIIDQILAIGAVMDNWNKSFLAESLHKHFNSQGVLLRISRELGDSYSMSTFLESANRRLLMINKKIYGGLRQA